MKEKNKSFIIVPTSANVSSGAVISSLQAVVCNNNSSFSRLSNPFQGTISFKSQNLHSEILLLMEERKCFDFKRKWYIMLIYPEKANVSAITDASDKNNIENID